MQADPSCGELMSVRHFATYAPIPCKGRGGFGVQLTKGISCAIVARAQVKGGTKKRARVSGELIASFAFVEECQRTGDAARGWLPSN